MFLADRLTITRPRRTKEGYLACRARAARAGVYDYQGREIDPDGQHFAADQVVKVYRPETEVFAKDAVHSFLMKPITDDHPAQPVTADSWKDLAKGVNAGAIRDGEYLAFDLVIMDADTIGKVEAGKRELSNGYSSEIVIEAGETADGLAYDAIQRNIRGNHIAIVKAGRAGPMCRISDVATCDSATVDLLERLLDDGETYPQNDGNGKNPKSNARRETAIPSGGGSPTQDGDFKMPHVLIIDGLQVPNVSDEAKAAIEKLQGQITGLTADKAALDTKVGEQAATIATKDGEIAALTQKVADAALSPAQLEKMVADRAALIGQAKAIDPNVVTDGKTEIEIRRAVVSAKLGDAAPASDDGIAGAFAVLSKDAPAADPVRNALQGAVPIIVGDAKADYEKSREARRASLSDAWKMPFAASAEA